MVRTQFDHLVVAATDLDTGLAWVRERLGVTVPFGGVHAHMGTHNCVGQLTPTTFLEIIAHNPDAAPDRPRWFSMDTPEFAQRSTREGAFLHHWVINSSDIAATLAGASYDAGRAIDMRRGALEWQIAVAQDGVLPLDGLVPTVIEWPDIPHPAGGMTDLGLTLKELTLRTPVAQTLSTALGSIKADGFCSVTPGEAPEMTATFVKDGALVQL